MKKPTIFIVFVVLSAVYATGLIFTLFYKVAPELKIIDCGVVARKGCYISVCGSCENGIKPTERVSLPKKLEDIDPEHMTTADFGLEYGCTEQEYFGKGEPPFVCKKTDGTDTCKFLESTNITPFCTVQKKINWLLRVIWFDPDQYSIKK
jgi:hypothetical protein